MANKVKLPKEVAKSMKFFLDDCQYSKYAMMRIFLDGRNSDHCVDGRILEDYAIEYYEDLLQALVNGYEVEQTPEDKVRDMFQETFDKASDLDDHQAAEWWRSRRKAIIDTLDTFDIKITGINA